MNYERPVVVCCMGRSGSSMVTGVLAMHGAWTGACVEPDTKRNPCWVLPRRDPEAIFKSIRRAGFWGWTSDETLRDVIRIHHEVLDVIEKEHGGVVVDTDAVVRGDRSSLVRAVEHAGLKYEDDVAQKFINPSFWGRKA